jgi:hypothetical protein
MLKDADMIQAFSVAMNHPQTPSQGAANSLKLNTPHFLSSQPRRSAASMLLLLTQKSNHRGL